jgi:hypothetical protein
MKIFKVILFCVLLTGCDISRKPDVVVNPNAPVTAPVVDPLQVRDVQWKAYNKARLTELLATLKDDDVLLLALDEKNFKALSDNLVDINTHIGQQNAVIDFLEKAIASHETATKDAKKNSEKPEEPKK